MAADSKITAEEFNKAKEAFDIRLEKLQEQYKKNAIEIQTADKEYITSGNEAGYKAVFAARDKILNDMVKLAAEIKIILDKAKGAGVLSNNDALTDMQRQLDTAALAKDDEMLKDAEQERAAAAYNIIKQSYKEQKKEMYANFDRIAEQDNLIAIGQNHDPVELAACLKQRKEILRKRTEWASRIDAIRSGESRLPQGFTAKQRDHVAKFCDFSRWSKKQAEKSRNDEKNVAATVREWIANLQEIEAKLTQVSNGALTLDAHREAIKDFETLHGQLQQFLAEKSKGGLSEGPAKTRLPKKEEVNKKYKEAAAVLARREGEAASKAAQEKKETQAANKSIESWHTKIQEFVAQYEGCVKAEAGAVVAQILDRAGDRAVTTAQESRANIVKKMGQAFVEIEKELEAKKFDGEHRQEQKKNIEELMKKISPDNIKEFEKQTAGRIRTEQNIAKKIPEAQKFLGAGAARGTETTQRIDALTRELVHGPRDISVVMPEFVASWQEKIEQMKVMRSKLDELGAIARDHPDFLATEPLKKMIESIKGLVKKANEQFVQQLELRPLWRSYEVIYTQLEKAKRTVDTAQENNFLQATQAEEQAIEVLTDFNTRITAMKASIPEGNPVKDSIDKIIQFVKEELERANKKVAKRVVEQEKVRNDAKQLFADISNAVVEGQESLAEMNLKIVALDAEIAEKLRGDPAADVGTQKSTRQGLLEEQFKRDAVLRPAFLELRTFISDSPLIAGSLEQQNLKTLMKQIKQELDRTQQADINRRAIETEPSKVIAYFRKLLEDNKNNIKRASDHINDALTNDGAANPHPQAVIELENYIQELGNLKGNIDVARAAPTNDELKNALGELTAKIDVEIQDNKRLLQECEKAAAAAKAEEEARRREEELRRAEEEHRRAEEERRRAEEEANEAKLAGILGAGAEAEEVINKLDDLADATEYDDFKQRFDVLQKALNDSLARVVAAEYDAAVVKQEKELQDDIINKLAALAQTITDAERAMSAFHLMDKPPLKRLAAKVLIASKPEQTVLTASEYAKETLDHLEEIDIQVKGFSKGLAAEKGKGGAADEERIKALLSELEAVRAKRSEVYQAAKKRVEEMNAVVEKFNGLVTQDFLGQKSETVMVNYNLAVSERRQEALVLVEQEAALTAHIKKFGVLKEELEQAKTALGSLPEEGQANYNVKKTADEQKEVQRLTREAYLEAQQINRFADKYNAFVKRVQQDVNAATEGVVDKDVYGSEIEGHSGEIMGLVKDAHLEARTAAEEAKKFLREVDDSKDIRFDVRTRAHDIRPEAERQIWAKYEIVRLMKHTPESIAKAPTLYPRYKEVLAILKPGVEAVASAESVDEHMTAMYRGEFLAGRVGDNAPKPIPENHATLMAWRKGKPLPISEQGAEKQLRDEIRLVAESRFKAERDLLLTVVPIEALNNTMCFYVVDRNTPEERQPLLSFVTGQLKSLEEQPGDSIKLAKVAQAIDSAAKDPRYPIHPVAKEVAVAVEVAKNNHLEIDFDVVEKAIAAVDTAAKSETGAEEGEQVSLYVEVSFTEVRRRFLAEMAPTIPAIAPDLKRAAIAAKAFYDNLSQELKTTDIAILDNTTLPTLPDDAHGNPQNLAYEGFKVEDKRDSIVLERGRGEDKISITLSGKEEGTIAKMKLEKAGVREAPAALATAAGLLTKASGNTAVIFNLEKYDAGFFWKEQKKAQREVEYVYQMLQKNVIPVFEQHQNKNSLAAVWNTYKDLLGREAKLKSHKDCYRDYLDKLFEADSKMLKDELVDAMFTTNGAHDEGVLKILSTVGVTVGNKMQPYSRAEFDGLGEAIQQRIIEEQAHLRRSEIKDRQKAIRGIAPNPVVPNPAIPAEKKHAETAQLRIRGG